MLKCSPNSYYTYYRNIQEALQTLAEIVIIDGRGPS